MSLKAAVRRHRWAIAAIFVASWGWALLWPHHDYTLIATSSHLYEVHAWGAQGAVKRGKNRPRIGRVTEGLDTLGAEGWSVDRRTFALECCLATLVSVVSGGWWISFRTPRPPGATPGWVVVVLGLAIWPALLGIAPVVWAWRQLGSVDPQGVSVLHPERMLVGTLYLVSGIGVWLGQPRAQAT